MFLQSNRNNPEEVNLSRLQKQKNTFIEFKRKGNPIDLQKDIAVYKIVKNRGQYYNYLYINNPYKLNLIDNENKTKSGVVLQSVDDSLYFVSTDEGRRISIVGRSWVRFEFRTLLHYVPRLNSIANYNLENEHLFNVSTEPQEFIAIGAGIDGNKFIGYKLTYVKSLKTNDIEIDFPEDVEQPNLDIDSTEEFEKPDLDDLL